MLLLKNIYKRKFFIEGKKYTDAIFSKSINITAAHLSQITNLSKNGSISGKKSRQIEQILNLPAGWIDIDHSIVSYEDVLLKGKQVEEVIQLFLKISELQEIKKSAEIIDLVIQKSISYLSKNQEISLDKIISFYLEENKNI